MHHAYAAVAACHPAGSLACDINFAGRYAISVNILRVLLQVVIARETHLGVGEFVHTFGDAHLYRNHEDQAREQLSRTPRPLPKLVLGDVGSIFDLDAEAIAFAGYDPWPAIKAPVAV